MKKYKFAIDQIVYIINDPKCDQDYKKCIIRKRKMLDGAPHYQLSESLPTSPGNRCRIFDIGFRNSPRSDNWLQQNRITEELIDDSIGICSKNGCELVNELLDNEPPSIKDIEDFELIEEVEVIETLIAKTINQIDVITDIFRENIDSKEQYLHTLMYRKGCLLGDTALIKENFIYAIE